MTKQLTPDEVRAERATPGFDQNVIGNRILKALWEEWQLRTDPESPNDLLGPEGMYGLDPETTDAVDKRRMHAAAQAMRAAEALYEEDGTP